MMIMWQDAFLKCGKCKREEVAIRIFGVYPVSPANGQEVWRGENKTTLRHTKRENGRRVGEKMRQMLSAGMKVGEGESEGKFCFLMLLNSCYAQTMVWTLDIRTRWEVIIMLCLQSLDTTFLAQLASSQSLMLSHQHSLYVNRFNVKYYLLTICK